MKTLDKQNKRTKDEEGETNGGDSYISQSNGVDLPLAKSNDDQYLVKNNKKQDKKMKKEKKLSEERKHKEYNEFQSNQCENDQGKKKKKRKLCDEQKLKKCDDFRSNEGENGEQVKKIKKKKTKLSEESKHEEYNEFKSNGSKDDDQGKKMKKKHKVIEGSTCTDCNDFRSNGGEDGAQDKKMKKKKKQNEESKHKEYREFKNNEGGDVDQGKKMKKNKPSHKSNSKENNDFNSNEADLNSNVTKVNDQRKKMKEKKEANAVTCESLDCAHNESPNIANNGTSKPKQVESKKKRKRVTFSDQLEKVCCDGLLRGKRFTPEEDEKITASVYAYIESHGLGSEGLDMVMLNKSHREVRGCWKEIAQVLPERPLESVYRRAHVLFENKQKKFTPEEMEFIRDAFEKHGADYRTIGETLGKSRTQIKDAWRRLKSSNTRSGHWTQEEYQTLFDLVNMDLRMRAKEPYRHTKHGMLRDNIAWEAIGKKLETRHSPDICSKWYDQLTSSMAASGDWCDADDYRLIDALYALDACSKEEVDWDDLLEHRSGDLCRKRWDQMVKYIGEHVGKSFIEQLEILAKRFCPDLLEDREAFDNKPVAC